MVFGDDVRDVAEKYQVSRTSMHKWTNDERMMIACCNDGTRPVIFKIERIDIPENDEESSGLKSRILKIQQTMLIRDEA